MDELKLRRIKKCMESGGHEFGHPSEGVVECPNCGLALEEIEMILGAEQ